MSCLSREDSDGFAVDVSTFSGTVKSTSETIKKVEIEAVVHEPTDVVLLREKLGVQGVEDNFVGAKNALLTNRLTLP